MTVARQVVPGRTYLISRRCTQRQFLLRPDTGVEQIYLYCLGEAAQRFDITLHGFIAMSNHQHIVIRDNRANFPDFLAHLHKMISKVMNARLERWENFWATEQPNAVYLVEAEDRFDKLVYLLANPVAGDLVDRVSDWPGACSLGLHLSGRTRTIRRPKGFFRDDGNMPAEVTLRLERPEGFESLSEEEWVAKLSEGVRLAEERAREARMRSKRGVLGRKAVLQAAPTDSPKTVAPRRNLRPLVACLNKARRIRELAALVAFRAQRLKAFLEYRKGGRDVLFPFGTYRVQSLFLSAPAVAPA